MQLLLTDRLSCPRCGPGFGLILLADRLADRARVSTVLVNQPHAFNNGGSFDNGLDFTLSMGAGTWGDNDSCENLTYKHFLNYTYLARPIVSTEPTDDELYGDFLARHG